MLVALEKIKGYLRIDSDAEDSLLTSLFLFPGAGHIGRG